MFESTMNNMGTAMGWDDVLPAAETVKPKKTILDDGEYNLTVTDLERGFFSGSDKLPECPMATVIMSVDADDGSQVKHIERFYLVDTEFMQKKNRAFFESIGLMEPGVGKRMPWDQIVGKRGRAHFRPKEVNGKHGVFTVNSIVEFCAPEAHDASETREPISFPNFGPGPNRNY